jgi:hypothetical protein
MASNLIIAGNTFSGTPLATSNPYKPSSVKMTVNKVGVVLVAANGHRRSVVRGTKKTWTIDWPLCNEATRAILRAIHSLTTTFSFTDEHGTVYATCQTEGEGDYSEEWVMSDPSNVPYYSCSLTIREA